MQYLSRIISRNSPSPYHTNIPKYLNSILIHPRSRLFSTGGGGDGFGWDDGTASSWSTGITKEHFDGEMVGHQVAPSVHSSGGGGDSETLDSSPFGRMRQKLVELNKESRELAGVMAGWEEREREVSELWKQVEEPGVRGSYLKDSEKAEMYKKHKENPEEYTVERLAKEYRIMRQRVLAILWLKEDEEEQEKKLSEPLDDSVELLLDTFPGLFNSKDREYHVASLPYKPDFKVMPEGWDGTTRDPDEVHYEISKKEDDMLYEEFVQRFNFNKMKFQKQINVHKYSRRRSSEGWSFAVEMLGRKGKRGSGGGWKFVSLPDGSTRPLNGFEKIFLKRETPRRRRKIIHPRFLNGPQN